MGGASATLERDCLVSQAYDRLAVAVTAGDIRAKAKYKVKGKKYKRQDAPPHLNPLARGSAMRVSPLGFAFSTLEETLSEARRSALARSVPRSPTTIRRGSRQRVRTRTTLTPHASLRTGLTLSHPLDKLRTGEGEGTGRWTVAHAASKWYNRMYDNYDGMLYARIGEVW